MARQWAEALVEIRGTLADIRGTTNRGADAIFPNINLTGLYVKKRIIFWHIFHSSGFHHICNIKRRLECRYSSQNIFNANNINPHKKPISLLNVPICTQGMQRTWWPEAGTVIVIVPYFNSRLAKSPPKLGYGWVITSHRQIWYISTH